jgi:hypothetical protein
MNKFGLDYFERMLITIKFRIFYLPVCCLKTLTILLICLLFCMGMKIDVGTSRVFDNRVLRRILGLKREEVTAGLEKLHNEKDELGGTFNTYGSTEKCIQHFGRKTCK